MSTRPISCWRSEIIRGRGAWLGILIALLASACASRERIDVNAGVLAEQAQLDAARLAQYETRDLMALEPAVLEAAGGRVVRAGPVLRLPLRSGGWASFKNVEAGCVDALDTCRRYVLIADLRSRHAFVVAELGAESADFHLVDNRTGQKLSLLGVPVFQPNGTRFLVIDLSGERSIRVWRWDVDGAALEFRYDTSGESDYFETEFVRWDEDRIELIRTDGRDAAERKIRRWPAELVRGPEAWRLVFRAPPPLPPLGSR
jgi:hypothetical protein